MKRLRQENRNSPEFFDETLLKRMSENKWLNPADDERFDEMSKYFKGGNYLDLGIGDSPAGLHLKKKFKDSNFYALDFAPKLIEFLRKKYPTINYVIGDCLDTPYKDNFFDYIIAGELIEHMEDPVDLVKEAMRILKPGGVFVISTPEREDVTRERAVDFSHMWSFETGDMTDLMKDYGRVEEFIFTKEHYPKIISYCWKNV